MWLKIALLIVAMVGIWVKCKLMDRLVAQHPELDEKEKT